MSPGASPGRSVRVGRDHLPSGESAEAPPGRTVDAGLEESDTPITEEHIDPVRVPAPRRDRRERRPAVFFPLPIEVDVRVPSWPAGGRFVRRPGGGDARLVNLAVGPLGVTG